MTKAMAARGRTLALVEHTNVTIVPSDEIDMSEEAPTDALYLFKYGCRFAPRHALVNICEKHASADAKRHVHGANEIRLSSCLDRLGEGGLIYHHNIGSRSLAEQSA